MRFKLFTLENAEATFLIAFRVEILSAAPVHTYDYFWLRLVITIVAVALLIGHALFRKLVLDIPSVCLVIFAVIPWLSPIVDSVEIAGLKVELHKLQENVADNTLKSSDAASVANLAILKTAGAANPINTGPAGTPSPSAQNGPEAATVQKQVESLLRQYEIIRKSQNSGPSRTAQMTGVVADLLKIIPSLPPFDIRAALASGDEKQHLKATCYLWVRPDAQYLPYLIKAAEDEKQAFIQYWQIEAIGRILSGNPASGAPVLSQLEALQEAVNDPDDQSRYIELARIISSVRSTARF